MMFQYPARFIPQPEGGYMVRFRDIPEAVSEGDDDKEAVYMAEDVIWCTLFWRTQEGETLPNPSSRRRGEHLVTLSLGQSMSLLLSMEMVRAGVSDADLAEKLNLTVRQVKRFTSPKYSPKLDRLENAMMLLGKRFDMSVAAI